MLHNPDNDTQKIKSVRQRYYATMQMNIIGVFKDPVMVPA